MVSNLIFVAGTGRPDQALGLLFAVRAVNDYCGSL